jgi:putative sigma-54 modulation protein
MKLVLSTHNIKLTKGIEQHILDRIDKLEHLNRWAVDARVIVENDNTRAPEKKFGCSIRLAVRGPDLFAEDHDADLYAAIDKASKKVAQQLRKRHSKHKTAKHKDAAELKRRRQESVREA